LIFVPLVSPFSFGWQRSARKITDLCRRLNVKIGIIAVPKEQAQIVCDQLIAGGVRAIWNFAAVQLRVPEHVLVRNEDLASSLALLTHQLQDKLMREAE